MLDPITIGVALLFMGASLYSYQLVRDEGSRFHWIGKASVVMLAIMACTDNRPSAPVANPATTAQTQSMSAVDQKVFDDIYSCYLSLKE